MTDIVIRSVKLGDKDEICALHAQSWKSAYREILPDDFLDQEIDGIMMEYWHLHQMGEHDLFYVTELEEQIVGFIYVNCENGHLIDNLHVMPEYRSQKIGHILLAKALDELRGVGAKQSYLYVISDNKKAISFYKRHGFVQRDVLMKDIFGFDIQVDKMVYDL